MNDQDRFLIGNWERSRQLELAMNSTREWYEGLFRDILKNVKQQPGATDLIMEPRMTQRNIDNWGGTIIFSKLNWKSMTSWSSGFCIYNISLDELASEEKPEPSVGITFEGSKDAAINEKSRQRIATEAPHIIKDKNISWNQKDPDYGNTLGWYLIPGGKGQLWDMLRQGKEPDFVHLLTRQISTMCGFIPLLDELFTTHL